MSRRNGHSAGSPYPSPGPLFRKLPVSLADLLLIVILVLGTTRLLVPLLVQAFATPLPVMEPQPSGPSLTLVLLLLAAQTVILALAVWLVAVFWRGVTWEELGFRPQPPGWALKASLLALVAFPAVGLINTAVQALFLDRPMNNPQLELLTPPEVTLAAFLGTIFVAGLLAPIAEEIAFRGLLYRWLRERLGIWPGILISSFAFGMMHGLPILVPAITLLGVLLAWIYEKTGSLWTPIILHAVYNSIVTATLYLALASGVDLGAQP